MKAHDSKLIARRKDLQNKRRLLGLKYIFLLIFSLLFLNSCGNKITFTGSFKNKNIISGTISPLVGFISDYRSPDHSFISQATAAGCSDPVWAKLFLVKDDGTIDENSPLASSLVGADAQYSFDMKALGLSSTKTTIQYIVQVDSCHEEIYKRPVTNFDNFQNIDATTTVVAEVINAHTLVLHKINEVQKNDLAELIKLVSGSTTSAALNSLTSNTDLKNKFTQIFGSDPDILQSARPNVRLTTPLIMINELAVSSFHAQSFHFNPAYPVVYIWQLDHQLKSSTPSWDYIPGANESGTHNVDIFIGKNDGSGGIDLTKPYFSKSFTITVNNNLTPVAPNWALSSANPNPVNSNNIQVDISTGSSLVNCASFSHLAITESLTPPGQMQFAPPLGIDCLQSGTQNESLTFSSGDGQKTLYLWAMDNEGIISSPKSISFVLDTRPPMASLNFVSSNILAGSLQTINFSASDIGVGLSTLDLYFSSNGGASYSLLSHLGVSDTTFSWSVPFIDTSNAMLKLVASDLASTSTTVYSNSFSIDSTPPLPATLTRDTAAISNNLSVGISVTCINDYYKILFSESSSTPSLTSSAWEDCSATKNFPVSTGDGLKTIYAFTRDSVGNISTSSNVTMSLDTTGPSPVVAALASASITGASTAIFTVADCLDRPFVIVTESIIAPSSNDSSWQSCQTTTGALTYTLLGPILQGAHSLYIYAKDASGNVSIALAKSIIFDTTNPTLSFSPTLGNLYKGGDNIALNFSGADTNGLSSLKLYYTADGVNYTLIQSLATSASTYSWSLPAVNSSEAKLKLEAIDNSVPANSTIQYSSVFTIDSTAPTAPTLTRISSAITASSLVTMSVGNCTDIAYILITESNSAPAPSAFSTANSCSTSPAAYTYTVSGDGIHTLYAWAKDAAGNVAITANSTSMTLDTTAPTLSLTSMNSGAYPGGSTRSITWSASDAGGLQASPISIEYSSDSGGTWTTIATNLSNTGSYSWSLPSLDSSTIKIKLSAIDLAGNIRTVMSSSLFTIDSTPPTLNTLASASANQASSSALIQINVNANDSSAAVNSGIAFVRFAEAIAGNCQSAYANNSWQNYTTGGVTQTLSFTTTFVTGTKKICAWAKDLAGNVSSISANSEAGTNGVDTFNYDILLAPAPQFSSITISNNTPGANFGTSTFTSGNSLNISFTLTTSVGLKANPVSIYYSTDGTNFNTLLASSISVGSTTTNATTWTHSFTQATAPTSGFFRLMLIAEDVNGSTSSTLSAPLNTNAWSVYAGNDYNGNGASALSARISLTQYRSTAMTSDGSIYLNDIGSNCIRKIDPATGKINNYLCASSSIVGVPSIGATPTAITSSTRVLGLFSSSLIADGMNLYLVSGNSNNLGAIFRINTINNTIELYAGGSSAAASVVGTTSNPAAIYLHPSMNNTSLDPISKDLYLYQPCSKTNVGNVFDDQLIVIKVKQDAVTKLSIGAEVVAGDCSLARGAVGFTASGQDALAFPILNGNGSTTGDLYISCCSYVHFDYITNTLYIAPGASGRVTKIAGGRAYYIPGMTGIGNAVSAPNENRVYLSAGGGISYFTPNGTSSVTETLQSLTSSYANASNSNCSNDNISVSSACTYTGSLFMTADNHLAYPDGVNGNTFGISWIRMIDNGGIIRTIAGTRYLSGVGSDASVAQFSNIEGLIWNSTPTTSPTNLSAGLYIADNGSVTFTRINTSTNLLELVGGNQILKAPTHGATFGATFIANAANTFSVGDFAFDQNNLLIWQSGNTMSRLTSSNTINNFLPGGLDLAYVGDGTAWTSLGLRDHGGATGIVVDTSGRIYYGGYRQISNSYNSYPRIGFLNPSDSKYYRVIGAEAPAGASLGAYTTDPSGDAVSVDGAVYNGSTFKSISCWGKDGTTAGSMSSKGSTSCYIQFDQLYNAGEGRLLFAEASKLRAISTPWNKTTSQLSTLFDAGRNIGAFVIKYLPSSSQIDRIYYISAGSLYCYPVPGGNGSTASCNNTALGPPTGMPYLSTATMSQDPSGNIYVVSGSKRVIYKYVPSN